MFKKTLCRLLSLALVLVLLAQMLPAEVLGAAAAQTGSAVSAEVQPDIVEEVQSGRSQHSKEFKLSNGLHMAVLYPEAVHYRTDDGRWEDIDNTLKATSTGFTNTAGSWNVSLPRQLSGSNAVTVTKDGYTLSFRMTGELRSSAELSTAPIGSAAEPYSVQSAATAAGQVQKIDRSEALAAAEYPEAVPDKLRSRLRYSDIYAGTDIVYDLTPGSLKESIVMDSYSQTLRGYRYTLETGDLTPVLGENGQIDLLAPDGTTVMRMPAPFLVDSANAYCEDVTVQLVGKGGVYVLTYLLPTGWLADQERQWPVILDPVITTESTVSNIKDITLYQKNAAANYMGGVLEAGKTSNFGIARGYLQYANLPALTSSDVVVSASLSLCKMQTATYTNIVEVHKVKEPWSSNTVTWATQPEYDLTVEDFNPVRVKGFYQWDITDIVQGWYSEGNTGLVLTLPKTEEEKTHPYVIRPQFYSSDYDAFQTSEKPTVFIVFRNNNGLESYWDYTSASAGRAGSGYVNNFTGNLVWTRGDMGFGGSRMSAAISHVYNANDAAVNDFGLGHGWRTNYNQRVYVWSENNSYYVWEDADGTRHYFYKSDNEYKDEDGLELTLTTTGSGTRKYCITDKYGNCSYFDEGGRLSILENNQNTKSAVTITYGTGDQIAVITDSVGREYRFTYESDLLTRIGFYGKGSEELFHTSYGYTGTQLTSVTDQDGETVTYTYNSKNLLTAVEDIDGYRLTYAYNTVSESWQPYRVMSIHEYDGTTAGGELIFEYAHNQTSMTDVNGNRQIHQFNNWGNTLSVQDGEGRAQYAQYATDADESGKANQLSLASRMQNTVVNVLYDASFEKGTTWTATSAAVSRSVVSGTAYYGSKALKLTRSAAGTPAGVYSSAFTVEAGETYTFSAWVKTDSASTAYLALTDGSKTEVSETLKAGSGWTRLQVSYTNTSDTSKTVTAQLLTETAGTVWMDAAQAEKAPTASRFNLVENGDFRHGTDFWTKGSTCTTSDTVTTAQSAAPQLDGNVWSLAGAHTSTKQVSQTVYVSGSAGDTLILSGWAKGDAVPYTDDNRKFGLLLTFTYTDGKKVTKEVLFHPDTDSSISWQYAAAPIVAEKAYSSVTVSLAYDNNANTALFDGIQLYKEQFGASYTYDANGNVTSVKDLQGQITTYEYASNNLTKILENNKAKMEYEYDIYHNVTRAITQKQDSSGNVVDGIIYDFTYDTYGNNTCVRIVNGASIIETSATYTPDHNRLLTTTDDLGNVTTYSYNENTNVLEWIQYPNDTETSRTTYTYDNMYRMASSAANISGLSNGSALTVEYTYTDDLLTGIETGSTTYSFGYGDFALRSNIRIGSRTLASYEYTDDRNFYLEKLTYGNGDFVSYQYDSQGRVVKETFEDGNSVSYAYDNNGALATVTDSASGRKTTYYYDFTDRLMKFLETGVDYNHSVGYTYDNINNLTALVETINGISHTTSYTYDYENRLTETNYGTSSETVSYDGFGRLQSTQLLNNDSVVAGSQFQYISGSTAGTQSTKVGSVQIAGSSGDALTAGYSYDANGNIIRYAVTGGGALRAGEHYYHYDTANQLVREDNPWLGKTFVWTYDNAGNIVSRKEYAYTPNTEEVSGTPTAIYTYAYEDEAWGDLLTAYNEVARTYDTVGNLLTDGTWTYTWQNGRELAAMTDGSTTWTYAYDVNGMRTSRTNGTATYTYVYNGDQLSQMTKGSDTLYFTYGVLGPTTVTWNGTTYYYALNAQGDVIGIFDESGNSVVTYNWDNAWGYNPVPEGTLAATLGTLNPLRYRGYVYDAETEYYYLQSRYYDPEIGRFLNVDALVSTGQGILGNNMFAYCANNPVNYTDSNGKEPISVSISVVILGVVICVLLVDLGARSLADLIEWISIQWQYAYARIEFVSKKKESEAEKETEPEPPDVTYPGDDPSKAPDGYEWKGRDPQGGKRGGYANPKGKDSWHPDLDHPSGVKPHWDYNDGLGHKWRVFPDRIEFVP